MIRLSISQRDYLPSQGGSSDTVFEVKNDTAPDLYCGNHFGTALTPFFSQETVRETPLSSVGSS